MTLRHRHRWDYERESKYWPGAYCVRCRTCQMFKVVPPDAATTSAPTPPEMTASKPGAEVVGTAGARSSGKSGEPRRSNREVSA